MKPKRVHLIAFALLLAGAFWFHLKSQVVTLDPRPDSEVEMTTVENGTTYKLHQGNLYRVLPRSGKWEFVKQYYDTHFYASNYAEHEGQLCRKGSNNEFIPVKRSFSEDFEGVTKLADLIGYKRGWTTCELQSPKAPKVSDYVKLRNRILKGESDFLDNRIEPSSEIVHGGKTALKTVSVSPDQRMVTAKSSLSSELLHFVKGDDVWMSIWCHVPKGSGMPFTVLDLETTWMSEHPGMRIVISDGRQVAVQFKGDGHAYHRQPKGSEVTFPTGQWVRLRMHLKLSEQADGVIEVWQDAQKIIDTRARTLVLANTIYNSFEIGISAYNEKDKTATLYVDDVEISAQPMAP